MNENMCSEQHWCSKRHLFISIEYLETFARTWLFRWVYITNFEKKKNNNNFDDGIVGLWLFANRICAHLCGAFWRILFAGEHILFSDVSGFTLSRRLWRYYRLELDIYYCSDYKSVLLLYFLLVFKTRLNPLANNDFLDRNRRKACNNMHVREIVLYS